MRKYLWLIVAQLQIRIRGAELPERKFSTKFRAESLRKDYRWIQLPDEVHPLAQVSFCYQNANDSFHLCYLHILPARGLRKLWVMKVFEQFISGQESHPFPLRGRLSSPSFLTSLADEPRYTLERYFMVTFELWICYITRIRKRKKIPSQCSSYFH